MKAFLLLMLASGVLGHWSPPERPERRRNEFKYPCVNQWNRYYLNNEPSEYGVRAGSFEPSRPTYVGRGFIDGVLTLGNIHTGHPRGFYSQTSGVTAFNSDSRQIWYLYKSGSSRYAWVNATLGGNVTNAVDVGTDTVGSPVYVSRFLPTSNGGGSAVGSCNPLRSGFFFSEDAGAVLQRGDLQYQVLTCVSRRRPWRPAARPERPTVTNSRSLGPANAASASAPAGCSHKWLPYNNDTQPEIDGVAAQVSADTKTFVGRTRIGTVWRPGSLQTVDPRGVFVLFRGGLGYSVRDNAYLWRNPRYTYSWASASGDAVLPNAVLTDDGDSPFRFPVVRTTVDGVTSVGSLGGVGGAVYVSPDGSQHVAANFEVLVCEPRPPFKCGGLPAWADLCAASPLATEAVRFASRCQAPAYVGRHHTACTDEIGAIAADAAGVSYVDAVTQSGAFCGERAQYLVRNASFVYEWSATAQEHALAVARDTFVGRVTLDGRTFVGTVKAGGEGLVYLDGSGKRAVASNYELLTCYSPYDEPASAFDDACRIDDDGSFCVTNEADCEIEYDAFVAASELLSEKIGSEILRIQDETFFLISETILKLEAVDTSAFNDAELARFSELIAELRSQLPTTTTDTAMRRKRAATTADTTPTTLSTFDKFAKWVDVIGKIVVIVVNILIVLKNVMPIVPTASTTTNQYAQDFSNFQLAVSAVLNHTNIQLSFEEFQSFMVAYRSQLISLQSKSDALASDFTTTTTKVSDFSTTTPHMTLLYTKTESTTASTKSSSTTEEYTSLCPPCLENDKCGPGPVPCTCRGLRQVRCDPYSLCCSSLPESNTTTAESTLMTTKPDDLTTTTPIISTTTTTTTNMPIATCFRCDSNGTCIYKPADGCTCTTIKEKGIRRRACGEPLRGYCCGHPLTTTTTTLPIQVTNPP